MPSESAETFERFLLWLYTRKLDDKCHDAFRPLCRLWVFADRLLIPMLTNFCIDAIKDQFKQGQVPSGEVAYIYENSIPTSGLRRMVVHVLVIAAGQEVVSLKPRYVAERGLLRLLAD